MQQQLISLAQRLVDQSAARVIVPAYANSTGFWFGGGNMVQTADGALYVVGRYRNHGDSRLGVAAGVRGLELAIFKSLDHGKNFHKVVSLSKEALSTPERPVLSIEGTALLLTNRGVELYVSTEKDNVGYPAGLTDYLKPGTGVWTIDVLSADSVEELATAEVKPLLSCDDPRYLHVKDPFVYSTDQNDFMFFCSHPFCWTSSNTGYIARPRGNEKFTEPNYDFFPRGTTWDVAMTRGTAVVDLPRVGVCADHPVTLMFYDGGECVRNLDEHSQAVKRPRGYSCEELGGLAYCVDRHFNKLERLSVTGPMFVSPHGTGCSRYVDVLTTPENWYVTWQQAQADGSQPLVMNVVPTEEVHRILQ
ncbi:MAG: hypothetical protein KDA69_13145 [Planctomycetaceae bacterium]|nr:hypothetical protein [Planctomycetaceae bacterium]MCA9045266.1 hypothetical protein [Planctomycetaceae bacterium]